MKKLYSLFVILMVMTTMSCCEKTPDPMETQIGDRYEGGYVFQTKTATQPGLICSAVVLSEQSNWDAANQLCLNYSAEGFSDWYLPSYDELKSIYQKLSSKVDFSIRIYWSSTPMFNTPQSMMYYKDDNPNLGVKTMLHSVIAVRKY